MKTLCLVRHAKSSWNVAGIDDADRPLLEKGIERTKKVIAYIKLKNVQPSLIISSTAKRAVQTADLFATSFKLKKHNFIINKHLYESDVDQYISCIMELDDAHESVLIVGHNPTITDVVNYFLAEKFYYLPASALVCISFDVKEWMQIINKKPILVFKIFPKEISI